MRDKVLKAGKIILYVSAILLFLYTVAFRTSVWINEAGFFGDEGGLIINLQTRNFSRLFLPLDFGQCCPPFILCLFKFVYMLYGLNETALRFLPYLFGILSCVLAFCVGKKIFKFASSSLLFASLMVVNNNLIYYSQEFKQYSSDVFFSLLIFYLFLLFKDRINTNYKALGYGILLGLSGFVSFASEFVVIPICFYFLFQYLKIKEYEKLFFMSVPYLMLTLMLFLLIIYKTLTGPMLTLPVWLSGCDAFESFETINSLLNFVYIDNLCLLMKILLFVGIIYLAIKERFLLFFLTAPILLNIISGYCHMYPFTISRVILWSIPFFLIVSIKAFDFLKGDNKILNIFVEIFIFVSAVFAVFNVALQQKTSSEVPYYFYRSNAKEYVLKLKNQNVKKSDVIFVDVLSASFDIYDEEHKYYDRNVIYQNEKGIAIYPELYYKKNGEEIKSLSDFPKGTNIWFYNCKIYGEEIALDEIERWISENTEILYKESDAIGDFLYVKKIR